MSRFTRTSSVFVFFVLSALHVSALDIALSYHMSNMDFAPDRSSTNTTYNGSPLTWGIDGSIGQTLNSNTALRINFTMDPILHNLVYGQLSYSSPYFAVSGGPLFGLFNSTSSLLTSGLRAAITARLPGIVYVTLDSGSTLSSQVVRPGDYSESMSDIALGFYVHNAICSFHVTQKGYVEKDSKGTAETSLHEYSFQADTYQKNVPYRILLKLGYQIQSKYFDYSTPVTQTVGAVVTSARITARLNSFISIKAGIETSIYTFGLDALAGKPANNVFYFRAMTGVELHPFSSSDQ